MKLSFALFVSVVAILLGGCETDRAFMTDEAYDARHPPAPHAPDASTRVPQASGQMSGRY